jgi:excisionase family DNA binding protein
MINQSVPDAEVCLRSIEQTGQILGLSKSKIYKLIASGELQKIKIGKKALIPQKSIAGFLSSLGV